MSNESTGIRVYGYISMVWSCFISNRNMLKLRHSLLTFCKST